MMIESVNVGPNCDLSHRILDGHDFSGLDLRYSDFHGSSLRNANFTNSVLHGANFVLTCLVGADFSSSKLIDPAVPFTDKEFSDYQQEGEDLAVEQQDRLREENWPDQRDYYFEHLDHGTTPFDRFIDALFATPKFFRWPASRHYRASESFRIPRWFSWDNTWDFFLTVPGNHEEEGFPFFDKPEWLRFERNWVRSYVLHNAAACFDQCEHDGTTRWAGDDEIRDYPYFNLPPQLKWAEIDLKYWDDPVTFTLTAPEECNICSGWFGAGPTH